MFFTILKVEAVEVCPLHQVAQGLRLKGCEARITDLSEIVRKHVPSTQMFVYVVITGRNLSDISGVGELNQLNWRVGLKVSIVDGLNQLLCDFNDLLFTSWDTEKQKNFRFDLDTNP